MREDALFIGVMSGTSLDAIDAVLVDFNLPYQNPFKLGVKTLARSRCSIPLDLREELLALHIPGYDELHRSQQVALELGHLYVTAIKTLLMQIPDHDQSRVYAAGVHGQTIRHCPENGYTLQLNVPAWIAEHTGLNIVTDFRSRDIAAGGQGAPLVPAFHAALLGCTDTLPTIVLNLGGISNISILQTDRVCGWDCGPANILMDAWCYLHTKQPFDQNGQWAASGKCLSGLLAAFLDDPYFSRKPPKSTGRDYFNLEWLTSYCEQYASEANPVDIQATLLALTAESIAQDIRSLQPQCVWVCGGGAHNTVLLDYLERSLERQGCVASVKAINVLGIDPCDVEAIAFAWLARQHVLHHAGNIPSVTGAAGYRCLGSFTPSECVVK